MDGVDVRTLDTVTLRRRVGYVPQEGGLLPHWTVRRNVTLVPWLRGMANVGDLADDALGRVGLPADRYGARRPSELSGGQRQRVALARAVAAGPAVVLLDEPFGALDALTRADMQTLFLALRRELALTAVLVTHDLHEAALLADRIAVLRNGMVEQIAPPATLLSSPDTPYVAELLARARLAPEAHG
jgi:osmoprotectant transport system ATP-binding protein